MKSIYLKVSDYSKDPYGRYRTDGEGNGTEYREDFILPELKQGNKVIVDLDGIHDEYGSSFLVEAFANLIRKEGFSYETLENLLEFRSTNKSWINEIYYYLNEAKDEASRNILRK